MRPRTLIKEIQTRIRFLLKYSNIINPRKLTDLVHKCDLAMTHLSLIDWLGLAGSERLFKLVTYQDGSSFMKTLR